MISFAMSMPHHEIQKQEQHYIISHETPNTYIEYIACNVIFEAISYENYRHARHENILSHTVLT